MAASKAELWKRFPGKEHVGCWQMRGLCCRFATEFGLAPVVVTDSQTEWFDPADFTFQKLQTLIGERDLFAGRRSDQPCSEEDRARGTRCHSIKELDPRLVGKEWAALRATNVTALGVTTYGEFMRTQVRPPQSSSP